MNYVLKWFYTSIKLVISLACIGAISSIPPEQRGLASPAATYIRVATTGTDEPHCGKDTTTPCRTIQYAVNRAGASGYVITVAEGVYTYDSAADQCTWAINHAVVCIVDKNITILGGYTTSNWYISDPTKYQTVIDGQNSTGGVMIIKYNATASLLMEGFTIQNGLARGIDNTSNDLNSRGFGGGISAHSVPMTLRHIILRNNRAIGGNNNNYSYGGFGAGGGVAIEANVSEGIQVTMEDMLIENNQASGGDGAERGGLSLGGGVFTSNVYIGMTDVTVRNNLALSGSSTGDGSVAGLRADALGGGIYMQSADLVRVQVINNQVIGGNAGTVAGSDAGGGLGGGLYIEEATSVTIQDSLISGNSAIGGTAAQGGLAFGGGMMMNYADVTVDRTRVIDNLAHSGGSSAGGSVGEASGGGLYMASYANPGQGHLTITNGVIADNQVDASSQGVATLADGAGITIQAVTLDLVHCTIANNQFLSTGRAGQAINIFGSEGPGGVPATANISYSIISDHINTSITNGNTSALTVYGGSTANLNTVMFYNNTNNTNSNGKPVAPGTINQVNSLFPNLPIGYVSPGSPNFNYHIQGSSPAIDQATGSTTSDDMDGQPRPLGAARDVGADEYIEVDSLYLPLTLR